MPVTPTGAMGLAIDGLRSLVASSATFQASVGAEDEAGAKARVHVNEAANDAAKPFAIVGTASYGNSLIGRPRAFRGSHVLGLIFVRAVDAAHQGEDDHDDATFDFLNYVDAIVAEMLTKTGSDDYYAIENMETEGERRGDEDEKPTEGNYFTIMFTLSHGDTE